MRNSFRVLIAMLAVIAVALVWVWPYVQMEFAGSAHYTEQDKREYDFYTPELLRKMPRISPKYEFDFANITGPATHIYTIKFYGTEDTSKINAYLESQGYKPQGKCNIDNMCWQGTDSTETVMVRHLKSEKGIAVHLVYDFT